MGGQPGHGLYPGRCADAARRGACWSALVHAWFGLMRRGKGRARSGQGSREEAAGRAGILAGWSGGAVEPGVAAPGGATLRALGHLPLSLVCSSIRGRVVRARPATRAPSCPCALQATRPPPTCSHTPSTCLPCTPVGGQLPDCHSRVAGAGCRVPFLPGFSAGRGPRGTSRGRAAAYAPALVPPSGPGRLPVIGSVGRAGAGGTTS